MTNFQDGSIEFEEFIRALSVTSRGNLDEKLHCELHQYIFTLVTSALKDGSFYQLLPYEEIYIH